VELEQKRKGEKREHGRGKTVLRKVSHLLLNAATQETFISVRWTEISHMVPTTTGDQEV